jgi:catechol 2,3-dioxygenase-like lactoylglutathione lyase family enzyme
MVSVLRLQHTSIPMPPDGHERARAFFGDALAMEEIAPPTGLNPGGLVWFRAGPDGQEVHCFVDERPEPRSNKQHLCLQVDDIEAYRARLAARGVPIEETDAIVNRPRFFVTDPFGNLIELTQITGDYT